MTLLVKKVMFNDVERSDWNDLVMKSPTDTIFQTYQWNKSVWDVYGKKKELYLLGVYETSVLIGVAPLVMVLDGKKRVIRFIAAVRGDYADFIYDCNDKKVLSALVAYLESRRDEWDQLILEKLPSESSTVSYLKGSNLNIFQGASTVCPAIDFKTDGDAVWRKLKKKTQRRHRYFFKQDGYEVQRITDSVLIQQHLADFFNQHIDRWSVTSFPSLFYSEQNKNFYSSMVDEMAGEQWVMLLAVFLDGKPIAYHLGFVYRDKFTWYKPTFDIALYKRSPGQALLRECFDFTYYEGLAELDFTVGDEQFKTRFANKYRNNLVLRVFSKKSDNLRYSLLGIAKKNKFTSKLLLNLQRIYRLVRREGLVGMIGLLFSISRRWLLSVSCVDIFSSQRVDVMDGKIKEYSFYMATLSDFIDKCPFELVKERQGYLSAAFNRIKCGEVPYVAEDDKGVIVAHAWVDHSDSVLISEVGGRLETKLFNSPNSVIKACWTHPNHRGKGIYTNMLKWIVGLGGEEKKLIYCSRSNKSSRAGIVKIFKPYKTFYRLVMFGVVVNWTC